MTKEEAGAFVRETERLKNDTTGTRSKFDAMVQANILGNGIMQPPANGQKPSESKDEGQATL